MSIFFQVHEFDCHDGTPYPVEWVGNRLAALCSQLDPIREAYGSPIKVVSGYRSDAWNRMVGGKPHSQHPEGLAADIQPVSAVDVRAREVQRLHELILRMLGNAGLPLVGGLGNYPGKWVHVDVRARPADGHVARWLGVGIGSEP